MRCHWIVFWVVFLLSGPELRAEGYTYPVKKNGPVEGILTVTVGESDASKPSSVIYKLHITWNLHLADILEPEIVDPAQAWKWQITLDGVGINAPLMAKEYVLALEQTKPGVQPLPTVKVRFKGAEKDGELEWTDILKETRPLPWTERTEPPLPPPEPAPVLWWIVGIVALSFALLGMLSKWFWPKKPSPPLTPTERALRELDRIEGLGLAGPDESGWYPEEISSVIRRFLSERYGLPAQEQTTAEFLHTLRQTPDLPEELQQTLKELLERCDLAKFAAMRTPSDECHRIAALARSAVQQATSVNLEPVRP